MSGINSDFQLRRDLQMTSQIQDSEVRGHEFLFAAFKHVGAKGEILKRTKLPLKLKLQLAFFDRITIFTKEAFHFYCPSLYIFLVDV